MCDLELPVYSHMAISIYVLNLTILSSSTTDVWPKIQIQDGSRRHLVFPKKCYLSSWMTPVWTCISNQIWRKYLYRRQRYGRETNPIYRPPQYAIFKAKLRSRVPGVPRMAISICLPNLVQLLSSLRLRWGKNKSKMAAAPSWISKKCYFRLSLTVVRQYLSANQRRCNSV